MKIQLLYFDGCPHWSLLEERLTQALDSIDESTPIERVRVNSQQSAEHMHFAGSPSILVDGTDPFGSPPSAIGLTCRVYSTPNGPAGSPTVAQLVEVLTVDRHLPHG